jgi:propanediol utilization protein
MPGRASLSRIAAFRFSVHKPTRSAHSMPGTPKLFVTGRSRTVRCTGWLIVAETR